MKTRNLARTAALGLLALSLNAPALATSKESIQLIRADKSVRTFTVDSEHVLQPASASSPVSFVRKASAAEKRALKGLQTKGVIKSQDGSSVMPVLRDATGQAVGLPGGLIVTFREDLSESDARARLVAAGLKPQEAIIPSIWTVESPAGLESIEIANRLNAQGIFADVSPNFWSKKTLK
ncbi:MAG: hypothetical protein Q4D19_03715 [Lautropia sp.]|nr:hypothetical protein [Lautropia sp.]